MPTGGRPGQRLGGGAYLGLQNRARREGRSTAELLTLYGLERFLWRLSRSRYAESLVLKGGLLLAALGARRTTADANLLAQGATNSESQLVKAVIEICALDDGVTGGLDGVRFDTASVRVQPIREGGVYANVRLRLAAHVASARPILSVDVNAGDPVVPAPRLAPYGQLLQDGEPFQLLSYPVEAVLAEKLCTAIEAGRRQHACEGLRRCLAPHRRP